jgi:hypothetical protein
MHVPCVSSGVSEHGEVPGRVIDSAFAFLDTKAADSRR